MCNLIKGYRYRFLFVWNDQPCIDRATKYGPNSCGRETNYVEVYDFSSNQINDYINEFNPDFDRDEVQSAKHSPDLLKVKSNFNSLFVPADVLSKTGIVQAKMKEITEFDDLDLISKMERH